MDLIDLRNDNKSFYHNVLQRLYSSAKYDYLGLVKKKTRRESISFRASSCSMKFDLPLSFVKETVRKVC